jgi:hypothetical protein
MFSSNMLPVSDRSPNSFYCSPNKIRFKYSLPWLSCH